MLLAAAYVITEVRTSEPMLPMRLFRSRALATGNAANILTYRALFSAVFFTAQCQQIALHQSPLHTELRRVPWSGAVFLIVRLAGGLVAESASGRSSSPGTAAGRGPWPGWR